MVTISVFRNVGEAECTSPMPVAFPAAVGRNEALAERTDIISALASRLIVVRGLSRRSRAQHERRSRHNFYFRQHV
jgi:hypothetical protein